MTTTANSFDLDETDRLLTTTRSVRKRLDCSRPVDRETVLECLRVAIQAPTGGNTQGWRWLVVDDPDVRARIADLYRRGYGPYMDARKAEVEAAGITSAQPVIDSSDYLAEHLHEVPVLVLPCILDRVDGGSNAEASGFYGSIHPAVWSFMLALRARGLGSTFTTLHLLHEREVGELLGIPDTVTQVALVPVAYFRGDDFKPASRRPIEEITYWNAWRQRA